MTTSTCGGNIAKENNEYGSESILLSRILKSFLFVVLSEKSMGPKKETKGKDGGGGGKGKGGGSKGGGGDEKAEKAGPKGGTAVKVSFSVHVYLLYFKVYFSRNQLSSLLIFCLVS
jgi:hypothetical protein